jgi:hypothetical protein
MKFRQNEFYAIEGNLLNLLTNENEKMKFVYENKKKHILVPVNILKRIINETIELDCQENNCSFNKERVDK